MSAPASTGQIEKQQRRMAEKWREIEALLEREGLIWEDLPKVFEMTSRVPKQEVEEFRESVSDFISAMRDRVPYVLSLSFGAGRDETSKMFSNPRRLNRV